MTLADLITRVRALDGPSREVDALVWAMREERDVRWDDGNLLARSRRPPHDECWLGRTDDRLKFRTNNGFVPPIPYFTSSLDAVLALVERKLPGWQWMIEGPDPLGVVPPCAILGLPGQREAAGRAPTAPLALLLALLCALEAGDA